MGDYYQIVDLAGVLYLVYCNVDTGWSEIAVQLTEEQEEAVDKHNGSQYKESREFYKRLLDG